MKVVKVYNNSIVLARIHDRHVIGAIGHLVCLLGLFSVVLAL